MPAKGVERWLSQRLSHRLGRGARRGDGVCAGVEFRIPRSLVAELTGTTDDDPWAPDALAWPLLEVLDDSPRRAVGAHASPLHLGHADDGAEAELRRGRRYAVARRLAGLFASYAAQRPQRAGRLARRAAPPTASAATSTPTSPGSRSSGGALVDRRRRPAAARAARRRAGPAARRRAGRPARRGSRSSATPGCRVTELELLGALADPPRRPPVAAAPQRRRCGRRWPATSRGPVAAARRRQPPARRPPAARDPRPRPPRAAARRSPRLDAVDHHHPGRPPARHAARLAAGRPARQRRRARPVARWPPTTARCRCTACHGAARQVDVLREVLLGLLQDDPTLEPRDILVMCPDIETYAPLITAGFGLGEVVGRRSPRPPAAGAARRPGAHPDQPAARRRRRSCSTSPAAGPPPARCSTWPRPRRSAAGSASPTTTSTRSPTGSASRASAGASTASTASRSGSSGSSQNTWQFGLDRVLAGVAMSDDARAWLGTTLPLDDVGSNRVELAGRLAEYVDRLGAVTDRLDRHPAARATGSTALGDGIAALTARRPRRRAGRSARCSASSPTCSPTPATRADLPLRLPDVRALLGRPPGRPPDPRQLPHRHPHRLHDGADALGAAPGGLPASASTTASSRALGLVDGDDVLARDPVTGERDIRSRGPPAAARRDLARPPRRWWSPTPAPTSTPASRARRPSRSASCSTPST